MKSLVATAPGKLVLCGEYAVLDGAPAISAAVDRRARVAIRDGSERARAIDVLVTTIGFRDGQYRYRCGAPGLEAAAGQASLPLFETAWKHVRLPADTRLSVELDTSRFFQSGMKLGLGSSAALTVALVSALTRWTGDEAAAESKGRLVHSQLQGGRGSGIDLATSTEGGLIRFERHAAGNDAASVTTHAGVTTLEWPQGLEAAVLFSGIAASTPARLERLDAQARRPESDALAAIAAAAAAAWQRGDAGDVLDATARFTRALADFSLAYDLDVFGGGHAALTELAAREGLVYKPCGAGGGDIGVVLGDDAGRVAAFSRAAVGKGFALLDVDLGGKADVEGLTIEWTHD